jgi:hypothetical protein
MPDAFANLVHTLAFICDWTSRDEDFARLSQILEMQLNTRSVSLRMLRMNGQVNRTTSQSSFKRSISQSDVYVVVILVQIFSVLFACLLVCLFGLRDDI